MTSEVLEIGASILWQQAREGWLSVSWPEGVIAAANPKACEMCARSNEELIGLSWWNLFDADSQRRLADWIASWQRGGAPGERAGIWLLRADDVIVPCSLRSVAPVNRNGGPLLIALDDRRELQRLAERLDVADSRLEDTQRVAELGWWEWELERNVVEWSDSLFRVMRLSKAEFSGTFEAFMEVVHPDDQATIKERLQAALEGRALYVVEFRTVLKDGSFRHIHGEGRVQRDENGKPIRMFGTAQDVTHRNLASQELRESERKYRELVETSNDLIWAVDEQWCFTFVNQACRAIYGYEPEEMIGRPFTDCLPPELIAADMAAFESIKAGEPRFHYQTTHIRKNGSRVMLRFNAIAHFDDQNRVIGTTGTATDVTERQWHEQLLKERENWFRAIFENDPQCLMILSPDGKLLDINSAGQIFLEAESSTALIGQDVGEFFVVPSRRGWRNCVQKCADGTTIAWQAQTMGKKLPRRWLEGQLVPLRDAAGQVIRLLASGQDVTSRRRADSFREGEQQVLEEIASGQALPRVLNSLVRVIELQLPSASCGVFLLNTHEMRLQLAASSQWPDELGRSLSSLPVDASGLSFVEAVVSGQSRIVEDTTTDPSWREFRTLADRFQLRSCWAQPLTGLSNEVLGVLVVFFQWPRSPSAEELHLLHTGAYLAGIATHRARSEQALRDSEARFRTLFEHSPDAIFVESLTGLVLDVNPAACELHGLPRKKLVGRNVLELVPANYHNDVLRDFPRIASGELRQFEAFSWHPKRGDIPVSIHVSRTEYTSQEALLLHVRDISARKRAEDKARDAESRLAHAGRLTLMGELMAGISHEINQPLFAIVNFASACEKTLRDPKPDQASRVLEWTHKISEQATRAGEIIRRMRDFSRKSTPHRSTVSVRDMIVEATELVGSETRQQKVDLHCEFPEQPLQVLADRIQIQQTIVNLLRNAYRAMAENSPDDRRVTVRARIVDGSLQISVSDNGHGFRGVDSDQIFNPFFTTKPDGLGLGLTISRSIVEGHRGKLWAEQNPDRGATFLFTLPVSPEALAAGTEA